MWQSVLDKLEHLQNGQSNYVERAGVATVEVTGKVAPKIFFKAAV